MAKIKLTKGELKRQRDALRQFERYLPTLQLKKKQLQMKILESARELNEKKAALEKEEASAKEWIGLLSDPLLGMMEGEDAFKKLIIPQKIETETENIAGANVPVLKNVIFGQADYDIYMTPLWIDQGIVTLREMMKLLIETEIIQERIKILKKELRTTTQRVNLFEKIKIPECLENIRKIRIVLGDLQANAVGISKVAKKKIEEYEEALAAAL